MRQVRAEFALVIDRNQDGSLPHHRAESVWEALSAKGLVAVPFCARKWAVCREEMVKHGVVLITDRDYHHGKAMRWAVGPYFPFLGLWKAKKQPSLIGPGTLPGEKEKQKEEPNTWLRKQPAWKTTIAGLALSRPPPKAAPFSIN